MPDPSALKMLVAAAEAGDVTAARAALTRDRSVLRDPRPLLKAARQGDLAMVATLLDAGSDPNRASRGDTPLHAAVYPSAQVAPNDPRRAEIVKLLLASGADGTRRGSWLNIQPLHASAFAGDRAAAEALIASGVPVDGYAACALGDVDVVRARLPSGLATTPEPSGLSAVHFAAGSRLDDRRCDAVLALLLGAGASPSTPVRVGDHTFEPVYFAVGADSRARTVRLIEAGATASSALAVALWAGNDELIATTYALAGTVDVVDTDGNALLVELIRWGQLGHARWVLERGGNVNVHSADGRTPLHAAASRGNTELVDRLLALGADPQAQDRDGHAPLDLARAGGRGPLHAALAASPRRPGSTDSAE